MKQLNYTIDLNTGSMTNSTENKTITIQEYENIATRLNFRLNRAIKEGDRLIIFFPRLTKSYRLVRQSSNHYYFDLPRELLKRGRLEFIVQHYNEDLTELGKYSPETHLYVTEGLDITNDTLESRPDLFAELYYKIEQQNKRIEKLEKAQGN